MSKSKPVLASVTFTDNQTMELLLHGVWSVQEILDIKRMLANIPMQDVACIVIDGTDLKDIDISSAWTLIEFARTLTTRHVEVAQRNIADEHRKIFTIVQNIPTQQRKEKIVSEPVDDSLRGLGKSIVISIEGIRELFTFFGKLCITSLLSLRYPHRFRMKSAIYHINVVGINALPIVCLMAFLISIVLAYQGALQLNKFGANIYTINLVGISLLREMGVIITSIIVAGRSGSAFAAQIGMMQVNQEIDAMRTFGLDPFEILVLPRMVALIIALPFLTFAADIVGLIGTMFICGVQLDITHAQFLARLHDAVNAQTFWIGLVKAPIFAILIGMTGCMQGLNVRHSAEEVGTRTTAAVVQSIFLVVLADAAFSVWFTWLGI